MRKSDNSYWISISDLMSGLMIIFMFIAISFMVKVNEKNEILENIAKNYAKTKVELYNELQKEFKDDLIKWNANIEKDTLSIKFNEPDIFFKKGEYELTSEFQSILRDFFPRYIKILSSEKYKDLVEEVRIEGHTSSEWTKDSNKLDTYFENMKLSQQRTASVLQYVMSLPSLENSQDFLIDKVTANGLSYSKRIIENGVEDKKKSRRVEFKVRTIAEKYIADILSESEEN